MSGICDPAAAFHFATRWTSTATNGSLAPWISVATPGVPATLTWGLVPDGTYIGAPYASSGEVAGPSSLVAAMDGWLGAGPGGSDLTLRPWFGLFQQSYNRIAELSGLTFVYAAYDDGMVGATGSTGLSSRGIATNGGVLNVRADLRIGAHPIDGRGDGILAYNYYPNNGDMVIDSLGLNSGGWLRNSANNYRRFRNLYMHETLHGLGLGHVNPNNGTALMNPSANNSFDGPQFDDILGLHRIYGDVYEKSNNRQGNQTAALATSLGTLTEVAPISVGTSARSNTTQVASTDKDFVSIDDASDVDFYRFVVESAGYLRALLSPRGPTYTNQPEGGSSNTLAASALSDLALAIFASDGLTPLASLDTPGLGLNELLESVLLPRAGAYFVQVTGAHNAAQMYRLDLSLTPLPEPASAMLVLLLASLGRFTSRPRSRS